MKSKTIVLLSLLIITLSISTIIGQKKDKSGNNFGIANSDEFSFKTPGLFFEESDGQIYDISINDFDSLTDQSDTILKIAAGPNIQPRGIVQNESTIIQIFKNGNNLSTGEKITIFEPILKNDQGVYADYAFLPMVEGQEYFVFLKSIDTFSGSKFFNFSSALYGKIPVNNKISIIRTEYTDDIKIDYLFLRTMDFIFFDTTNIMIQYNDALSKEPGNTYYVELLSKTIQYNEFKNSLIKVINKVQEKYGNQIPTYQYQNYP